MTQKEMYGMGLMSVAGFVMIVLEVILIHQPCTNSGILELYILRLKKSLRMQQIRLEQNAS